MESIRISPIHVRVIIFYHERRRPCFVCKLFILHPVLMHVMLPKDIAKLVPKTHLMSESEWRNLGVQQSQGWVHYMIHEPDNEVQLFADNEVYFNIQAVLTLGVPTTCVRYGIKSLWQQRLRPELGLVPGSSRTRELENNLRERTPKSVERRPPPPLPPPPAARPPQFRGGHVRVANDSPALLPPPGYGGRATADGTNGPLEVV
ncbi:hypothetical protein GH733_010350 [Mirounga leonina]|nr:hypothetical protein GH733_010350 [Mirounga leonina]